MISEDTQSCLAITRAEAYFTVHTLAAVVAKDKTMWTRRNGARQAIMATTTGCILLYMSVQTPQPTNAFNPSLPGPTACSSPGLPTHAKSRLKLHCHRPKQTAADAYFAKHGKIPPPSVMHSVLAQSESRSPASVRDTKSILVIGDVHGCLQELKELHSKAVCENDGQPFRYVVLVGDLCNKGPQSAQVIRFVRTMPNWYTVRGNHDDAALAVALGNEEGRKKKKYRWITECEMDGDTVSLSDEDVNWMSELPYSITIPGSYLGESQEDIIVVHAGIIPDIELESQPVDAMIAMREVIPKCNEFGQIIRYTHQELERSEPGKPLRSTMVDDVPCNVPQPWASLWRGPQRVIFGHDARRGLQRYDGDWAIGLDTGAVYGKHMTGIILPRQQLVSIKMEEVYSPV